MFKIDKKGLKLDKKLNKNYKNQRKKLQEV